VGPGGFAYVATKVRLDGVMPTRVALTLRAQGLRFREGGGAGGGSRAAIQEIEWTAH